MSSSVEHTDVGAYALGLLEEDDRLAFEAHLATCARCQEELDDFGDTDGLRGLFADVDPDAFTLTSSPGSSSAPAWDAARFPDMRADGIPALPRQASREAPVAARAVDATHGSAPIVDLAARRAAKQRGARRAGLGVAAAAAAALLLVAGVAIGGGFDSGDDGRPTVAQSPDHVMPTSPAGQLLMTGERHPATGFVAGSDGVTGAAAVETKGWGSHIGIELRGVRGPLQCSLIAVGSDGRRETIGAWTVPAKGYGVPGSPDPLIFHGGSSIPADGLDHLEVVTAAGATLMTVPVRA